jgi:hypothetical protein
MSATSRLAYRGHAFVFIGFQRYKIISTDWCDFKPRPFPYNEMLSTFQRSWHRSRLLLQCLAISFVALCSQSWLVASRIISTAANHFGALGAGSPCRGSLPTASKTCTSLFVKPRSFAVAGKSIRNWRNDFHTAGDDGLHCTSSRKKRVLKP